MSAQPRTVIVTGAAAGIGQGISRAFAAEGDTVWMVDFRERPLAEARESLESEGFRAHSILADLKKREDVERIVPTVLEEEEGIDVLVNNAGIYPNNPVVEMGVEEWDRVLDTNLKAPFLLCRSAARAMIARGKGGKIVNIGSGAAFSGRVGAAHYCTSKAGLLMFTKVLALELAPHGINVNVVSPGLTDVKSETSPLSEEYVAALVKNVPLGRMARPEDIAPTVLFMASRAADYITGAEISVNGGSTAGRAFLPLSG